MPQGIDISCRLTPLIRGASTRLPAVLDATALPLASSSVDRDTKRTAADLAVGGDLFGALRLVKLDGGLFTACGAFDFEDIHHSKRVGLRSLVGKGHWWSP